MPSPLELRKTEELKRNRDKTLEMKLKAFGFARNGAGYSRPINFPHLEVVPLPAGSFIYFDGPHEGIGIAPPRIILYAAGELMSGYQEGRAKITAVLGPNTGPMIDEILTLMRWYDEVTANAEPDLYHPLHLRK